MKNIFIILILSLSPHLLAVENGSVQKIEKDVQKSESSNSKTSFDNREGKSVFLTYGGGYNYTLGSQQVEVLYYQNKNFLYGVEGSSRSHTAWGDETKSIAAKFRHFTGNSFNYSVSAFYREYNYENTRVGFDGGNFFTKRESKGFKDIGLSATLGNIWQWKYFTLGVDWIGVWSSVSKTEGQYPEGEFFSTRQFGLNLLSLRLGLSF